MSPCDPGENEQSFSAYPALPPPVRVRLTTLSPHDCAYLPGRSARSRAFLASEIPPEVYHRLMDAGFRRSGQVVYQPVCAGCRACVPIRLPVAGFRPNRSQRRCATRNADLRVTVAPPRATDESHALYARYLAARHDRSMDGDRESMEEFLYASPVRTLEFSYRDAAGALLAVGICDASERSLSSVYFFFEPEQRRRGLGIFGALTEIAFAAKAGIPYYYLGYWVDGCATMRYKTDFAPYELLDADGVWRPTAPDAPASDADRPVARRGTLGKFTA